MSISNGLILVFSAWSVFSVAAANVTAHSTGPGRINGEYVFWHLFTYVTLMAGPSAIIATLTAQSTGSVYTSMFFCFAVGLILSVLGYTECQRIISEEESAGRFIRNPPDGNHYPHLPVSN